MLLFPPLWQSFAGLCNLPLLLLLREEFEDFDVLQKPSSTPTDTSLSQVIFGSHLSHDTQDKGYKWGYFESHEEVVERCCQAVRTLMTKHPQETDLRHDIWDIKMLIMYVTDGEKG